MILLVIVALFCYGESTGAGGTSEINSGYKQLLDYAAIKNINPQGYDVQQYGQQKVYVLDQKSDDRKKDDDEKDDGHEKYGDKDQNLYEDKYRLKNRGDYREYNDDKYDSPNDYLISDKRDYYDDDKGRYNRRFYDNNCYDKYGKRYDNDKCRDRSRYYEDRYYDKDCYDKDGKRYDNDECRDCFDYDSKRYNDKCRGRDRYYNNRERYCYEQYNRFYDDKDCFLNGKRFFDNDKCQYENSQDQFYDRCYDKKTNVVGLEKDDNEDYLTRPCALEDYQCIRKYFARNSKCKIAYGPIPDPLYLRRNTLYLPFANITLILTRLRVTGLGTIKISEFYVNRDTGNLVLGLEFSKLNLTTPRAYFRYKRTAKESIVLSDYATLEYNTGTFTAVIPKIPHLRLDLAELHVFHDDLIPGFFLGPRIVNSTDPDVITGFARFASEIPLVTQEAGLFISQLFTAIYIQENICDFGLKIKSV